MFQHLQKCWGFLDLNFYALGAHFYELLGTVVRMTLSGRAVAVGDGSAVSCKVTPGPTVSQLLGTQLTVVPAHALHTPARRPFHPLLAGMM